MEPWGQSGLNLSSAPFSALGPQFLFVKCEGGNRNTSQSCAQEREDAESLELCLSHAEGSVGIGCHCGLGKHCSENFRNAHWLANARSQPRISCNSLMGM